MIDDQLDRTCHQPKAISKEDPMSHRIIEKRRRDRMNSCLADLSRLIPAEYMKKGRGRVEKTEIVEMAIKHMKHLQSHVSMSGSLGTCNQKQPETVETEKSPEPIEKSMLITEQYKMGFFECLTETMQYLVEGHGYPPRHGLCLSLINHLQEHCAQVIKCKQVVRDVVKDKIILEVNRLGGPLLVKTEDTVDGSYDESHQQLSDMISKSSKSQSSINTSNDQTSPDRFNMSYTDLHSSNGSMYKFKTDIKQRFSAENSGDSLPDYYTHGRKRSRTEDSGTCNEDSQKVPIFALHANGSYYIPLTINRQMISPILDSVISENRSSVIVHPISISVNFQTNNNPS
ncbi:transcription factor cwo isoform X2 [Adelges cooleyi]|uniref:transcription factor cwo isoform X2 n=1 Tax=Adelges cooleyi TaxID=133065 RepID=UPI00217FCB71|nr:transcription factor cwo isoform X2 [Adelges cooleyi]